ncbi:unnamed protein product, partial [Symbiodinium necroappetens]
ETPWEESRKQMGAVETRRSPAGGLPSCPTTRLYQTERSADIYLKGRRLVRRSVFTVPKSYAPMIGRRDNGAAEGVGRWAFALRSSVPLF